MQQPATEKRHDGAEKAQSEDSFFRISEAHTEIAVRQGSKVKEQNVNSNKDQMKRSLYSKHIHTQCCGKILQPQDRVTHSLRTWKH